MKKTQNVEELQAIARTTRRQIIEMITAAKSGHPGGSLSAVEILVTLFFDVMNHDPSIRMAGSRSRHSLEGTCLSRAVFGDGTGGLHARRSAAHAAEAGLDVSGPSGRSVYSPPGSVYWISGARGFRSESGWR